MIAVIGGCGSNIASVMYALQRLNKQAILTIDRETIQQASHVILPGVGHARFAMQQLKKHQLIDTITQLTQPVLGICLGMQLMFEHSAEGNVDCLGLIPGSIQALASKENITLPHMGWNNLQWQQSQHPLQRNLDNNAYVYFVHSFAAAVTDNTLAYSEHGQAFSAIVNHNNFYAMQFHPERSGQVGETLLNNFLTL